MRTSLKKLLSTYREIDKQFQVVDSSIKYADLVTANGNQNHPVQRWFHLKEAFSVDLLEALLRDWKIPADSVHKVLDPFCGVGTSLLATQKLARKHNIKNIEAVGIERNPFLHFVAQTKQRWHRYDAKAAEEVVGRVLSQEIGASRVDAPSLSTIHRKDVYSSWVLNKLLGYRDAILTGTQGLAERDPLLLGYASILEPTSGVRKDGRALRIVPGKQRPRVKSALKCVWDEILADLAQASQHFRQIKTRTVLGDGRRLASDHGRNNHMRNFDLIVYSPPYLNNIDYTEVYKIELWMCGFVDSAERFRDLRHETFRSHPSVRFLDPVAMNRDRRTREFREALDSVIGALPADVNLAWRKQLFREYFDDMYVSLKRQKQALAPGGWIFCVVGNSLHGPTENPHARTPVAADLLIAFLADSLGLSVRAIQIARYTRRRSPSSKYIRESILVMQKPQ